MGFKCYICFEKFDSLELIVSHLKIIHSIKDNVHQIKCVVDSNCDKMYSSFKRLKAHSKSCIKEIATNDVELEINGDMEFCEAISNDMDIVENVENEFIIPCIENLQRAQADNQTCGIADDDMIEPIDTFIHEIVMLGLNNKDTDAVFNLCEKFASFCFAVTDVDNVSRHVLKKLHSMNTHKKREKYFNGNDKFVRPEPRAIGLHTEMKKDPKTGLNLPKQIQSQFQYVPITKQLISLFDQPSFKRLYMEYNSNLGTEKCRKHVCEPGRYRDYCCGKVFKENPLFKMHPSSIQIQLYIDGFEICDPLKSKAGVHSQTGVYFAIRNLPHQLAFDPKNIHLVAMCYSNDINTKYTDYNNIWNEIVRDVRNLEENGIILDSQNTLRGILLSFKPLIIIQSSHSKRNIFCL